MVTTVSKKITLEDFLKLPETKPYSEFIDGEIHQKPMPQGEHSRIQSKLVTVINQITESAKVACAFSELRCTFGGISIVPDVTVFRWERIIKTEKGRIANRFNIHPDWCIYILSPQQNPIKVLDHLLFCSKHGTELGWLIDPEEETVLIVEENQRVNLLKNGAILPVLKDIDLSLKVEDIFAWLIF